MNSTIAPGIPIHPLPRDLKKELIRHPGAFKAWNSVTPLARNEWICWVESAKLIETRSRRIQRTWSELEEGIRRPCCWPGCRHRAKNGRI